MKFVLDTSLFFTEYPFFGDLFTTASVVGELVDLRSKCRYEALLAQGLRVLEPAKDTVTKVWSAAKKTGDAEKISPTDCDVLAVALELGAVILSDDFAVHNVAKDLGITVHPVRQRMAAKRIWKFRCSGCGRFSGAPGECPVCGSKIKRTMRDVF
jgi:UPF0271 protein